MIDSSYSSSLRVTNPTFSRPHGRGTLFYYQLFQINVPQYGAYAFETSSSVDTFRYLYSNTFDPSSPTSNLLTFNDDALQENQCLVQAVLSTEDTYYAVITTYLPDVLGNITMDTSGSADIDVVTLTSE